MRLRILVVAIIGLTATQTLAQEVVDGSEKYITATELEAVFKAARNTLNDGYSAKFSYLSKRRDHICGFVNAKNLMGAYAGNTAFRLDTTSNEFSLLPPVGNAVHDLSKMVFEIIGCPTSI